MAINVVKKLVSPSKYNIKCPYTMDATRIVVHNTYNDASARNEIEYMTSNNAECSFHFAIDDKEVVQGIPLNRNAWHAGDGLGKGNLEGIGIEICYSLSGGSRFIAAEKLAAKFIAQLLKERGWGLNKVTKHQDYMDKYCLPVDVTELLTPDGWKNLLDIRVGDMVAQYENGNIAWEKVLDVVDPYEDEVVKIYKTEATKDHRMLSKNTCKHTQAYKFRPWEKLYSSTTHYTIPTSGQLETKGLPISDGLLLLLVWVQGDGHYMKSKSKKTGENYYIGVEFHLSKQRKIDRLLSLLNDEGIQCSHKIQSDGTSKIRLFGRQYVEFFEQFLDFKKFSWELLKMNKRQFDLFFNEIQVVDGCINNSSYCSTIQKNMDIVQALCAINGVRCNQVQCGTTQQVIFSKSNMGFNGMKDKIYRRTVVSCVSVPSGAILIRQYNQPKIVGNCPHRTLDMGWARFKKMVQAELDALNAPREDKALKAKVQKRFGFADGTMDFLSKHSSPRSLYAKLADTKKKAVSPSDNLNTLKKQVQERFGFADGTIKFLSGHSNPKSLFFKLASKK